MLRKMNASPYVPHFEWDLNAGELALFSLMRLPAITGPCLCCKNNATTSWKESEEKLTLGGIKCTPCVSHFDWDFNAGEVVLLLKSPESVIESSSFASLLFCVV